MSLRTRLIASIMLVLLVSLGAGGLSAGWTAARSVRNEMQAALGVGEQGVQHGLDDLPGAPGRLADLTRLVQAFDGDRHLRATLVDAAGRTLAASALPRPAQPAPGWFVRLVAPALPARRMTVEAGVETGVGRSAVVLEAEPLNEAGEVWTQRWRRLAGSRTWTQASFFSNQGHQHLGALPRRSERLLLQRYPGWAAQAA